ncbi:hypothetical protein C8R45DRAFT_532058 [Mycena sanguinolenta]|nr:hypothetical protein C8R45DRAFT_532058 [Mycena sanguinolenta]
MKPPRCPCGCLTFLTLARNWFPESFPWLQPIKCPQITTFGILRPSEPTTSLHSFKFSPIMVHVPFVFQTLIISLGPLITSARPLQSRGMGVGGPRDTNQAVTCPTSRRTRAHAAYGSPLFRHRNHRAHRVRNRPPCALQLYLQPQQHCAATLNSDVQNLAGYQALLADANSLLGTLLDKSRSALRARHDIHQLSEHGVSRSFFLLLAQNSVDS